jgi:tetratricopeptide (TPR) repeat protein/transglutaminase-like putative cysteine protease
MGRIIRSLLAGLLALVWSAAAAAATNLQFGPPPQWVRPVTLPAPGVSTQAAVKVLLIDYQVNLTRNSVSYYAESVTRIQTPEGLSQMGTLKVVWDPDTDVVVIHRIHILRGDKVIDVLGSGQTFTVARREVNLDYAAIDDTLTGILEPADLEVGDILDVAYTLERTEPLLKGASEAEVEIPPMQSVAMAHVSALWPTSDPVKWQAGDGLTGIHPIRIGDMSGIDLTMTDLQPIVEPNGAPLRFLVHRRLDLSSFGSWGEVAQRFAPLYAQAARLSPKSPLQAEIATIRAASPDPKVRAAMALSLVEDKVRYVLLDMNEGGLVPADADLTWSRRYGDCKAKTGLLLALLHGLGIEAQPVVVNISRGDGLDERLPMAELFDHVLVESVIDGQTYWLDGTRMGDDSLDQLSEPFYHWGLPLVPSGARLTEMVPPPLTQPVFEAWIEVDASGGVAEAAPVHAQTEMHGPTGVLLRAGFGNMTPTQLDAGLRSIWARIAGNVKILSVAANYDTSSHAERLTMDGTVTMDFSGGSHLLGLLNVGRLPADLKRDPGPNANAPYAVPYPTFERTTEVIKLPANGKGFSLEGADLDRTVAGTEIHRHASIDGGRLTATLSVRSTMPEFPASEEAADQEEMRKLAQTGLSLEAPKGHLPTTAEIAWGLPPSNITAVDYVKSAFMLSARRKYDDSIADYDAALALDSRNAMALALRGQTYLQMGDQSRARTDIDAALMADPHSWAALDGRGSLAFVAGDNAGAIAAFSAAINANPGNDLALPMRAEAYWCIGRKDLALADYTEVIQRHPNAVGYYWYRAVLLRQQGNAAESLRQAQLVTTANPKSPGAYFMAATIYLSQNKVTEAGAAFDRAMTVVPPVAQTYVTRAGYRLWTDLPGKRADIEKALQLDPESATARVALAQVQMAGGDYAAAAASLTTAMQKRPDSPEMLASRGIAYDKAGQSALAQADFTRALALAKQPGELNNLCWTLATADVSLPSALDDCNTAVAKAPTLTAALDSRGFVLMRLGRYDQAIASYDSALKRNPVEIDSLYGRGICELRSGKKKPGDADIKAATSLSYSVADEFAHYGVQP